MKTRGAALVVWAAVAAAVAVVAGGVLLAPGAAAHGTCDDHQYQVRPGEPGWSPSHDGDHDGIGCESKPPRPSVPPPATAPPATAPPPAAPPATSPLPPPCTQIGAASPPAPVHGAGYWMLESDGTVYGFGDSVRLDPTVCADVVAIDAAPNGTYRILRADGVVVAAGGASWHGDANPSALLPGEHVSSISGHPSGNGYWIFTDKGRALPFGAAAFYNDMSAVPLTGPVIASASTPSGSGYWMIASDGGVFSFGDAQFYGSMGAVVLNSPVVGIAPDPDGAGYWLVAGDGGIFAFEAPFRGSLPDALNGQLPNQPVIGELAYGNGYLMVAADGGIFSFSDQPFLGSLGANPAPNPIVGVAVSETRPTAPAGATPTTPVTAAPPTTTTTTTTTTAPPTTTTTTTTAPPTTTTTTEPAIDPPVPPTMTIVVENIDATSARISVTPETGAGPGGPPTSFDIDVREDNQPARSVAPGETAVFVVLRREAPYLVEARAVNSAGPSAYTSDSAPAPPPN